MLQLLHEGKERVEDRQKSNISKDKRMVICLTCYMISTNYIQQETNWMLQLHNNPLVSCWLLPTAFNKMKGMKYTQYSHWLKSKVWSKTVEDVTDNHHMTKCMTVCSKKMNIDDKWGVDKGEGMGEMKKVMKQCLRQPMKIGDWCRFFPRDSWTKDKFQYAPRLDFSWESYWSHTMTQGITPTINIKLNQSDNKSTKP